MKPYNENNKLPLVMYPMVTYLFIILVYVTSYLLGQFSLTYNNNIYEQRTSFKVLDKGRSEQ